MKNLAFLLLFIILCGILAADTAISGSISTSQTWTLAGSPYIVTGNVAIHGNPTPIVTIEAGVQVKFNSGAGILLGDWNFSDQMGGMIANGTEAAPVLLTANSASPTPGFWNYIFIEPYTSPSTSFSHTIFEYGGSGGTGMFTVYGGSPSFSNCTFRNSSNYAIYHSSDTVTASVSGCSFEDNGTYPLRWNPQFVPSIGDDNTFTGNGFQRILLKSLTVTGAVTWTDKGIPFEMDADLTLHNHTDPFIMQPGTELQFKNGRRLYIGDNNYETERGHIIATGATFSAANPAQGWSGLSFLIYTLPSTLTGCTIKQVNSVTTGAATINCDNTVAFDGCVFTANDNYAIYCYKNKAFTMSGCTLSGNAKTVGIYGCDVHRLLSGNTYTGNTENRIQCFGDYITASAVWTPQGTPIWVTAHLYFDGSGTPILDLPFGLELQFNPGLGFFIGDNNYNDRLQSLHATGVTFKAANAAQGWNGLYFGLYMSPSYLESCEIRDVSSNVQGAVMVNCGALLTLQDCLFTANNTYAVYCNWDKSFTMSGCTISGNAKTVGLNARDLHKLLTGNSYIGNTENRIHCWGETIDASASWTPQGTPVWVTAHIYFNGEGTPVLDIPAGIELQFNPGLRFMVGSNDYSGRLQSLHASGATFKAADPVQGWYGLYFSAYMSPSYLDSCIIRDVSVNTSGAVTVNSNSLLTLQNCLFTANNNYAVRCYSGKCFAMSGCTLSDNANTVAIYACDMQQLLTGNVYTGNTDDRIHCLGGGISASATWTTQSIPILVSESINYDNAGASVLNIPLGVELRFASAKGFYIGSSYYSDHHPALRATGVTFRGAESTPGYWYGMSFYYYGDPSLLSGCVIRDAGYSNTPGIQCDIISSTITGCMIQNCLAKGINLADNSMVSISGNTITSCGSYPLSIHVEKLRALTEANDFTGNTIDRVEVRAGTVVTSGVWHNPGVPYQLTNHCYIDHPSSPHIRIMPGTVVMLPDNVSICIGSPYYPDHGGSLEVEGVTFTRSSDTAIPQGLIFYDFSTPGVSSFTDCIFEYLRSGYQCAVYADGADPVFDYCVFRNNPAQGLTVTASARPVAANCQFTGNGGYPISAACSAFGTLNGGGNYFSGNATNRILLSGQTLTADHTWNNPGIPVEISSNLYVDVSGSNPVLKLNSGLSLLFRTGVGLYIGSPYYSDHGGSLQADGATLSALSGAAGGWTGIQFYVYSGNTSYLSGCVVEYAGTAGNIRIDNAPLPYIDSCVIRHGDYGIYATGGAVLASISKNYIYGNGVGVYCANNANPIVGGSLGNANSIDGNTTYGVQNTSTGFNVNALHNWWGDPSGPYHAGLNPGGLGDNVSNYVDFDPWRLTNIGDAPSRFHLLTPASNSAVPTLTPALDWEEAIDPSPGDMVTYVLYIALNAGFSSGLITFEGLASSAYQVAPGILEDDTRYYWKVSATDTQDQTVWCYEAYFYFDTAFPEPPLAFGLNTPTYNETVHLTSNMLDWQASSDPDPGDYVVYTVYWDISAGFETAGSLTTSGTSAWSGFCAPGSLIYWKVRAFDSTGRETFSPIWRFYVHPDAKPRPPVDFTITPSGGDLLIGWDDVPGADSYDINYSTEPYSGFNLLQAGLASPSFLHPGAASGPTGFYQVKAHDTQ
jgi:nitrous oxidase accessory protein NosD